MAGFAVNRSANLAHKGFIWGVYVRPKARRNGIGRALVEAAIGAANGRVELLQLTVERGATHARRLYIDLGFVEYGLEVNARRVGDRTLDDVLMAKQLV
jgi:ribosomal protein S18 acetylase RimI-like enzyme